MALGNLSDLLRLQQASQFNQFGNQQQFSTGFVQTVSTVTPTFITMAPTIYRDGGLYLDGQRRNELLFELRGRVQEWLAPIEERLRKYT